MSTEQCVNHFKEAWKHYQQSVKHYRCDDGVVEFRYQAAPNGESLDVIISYIETNNNEQLHLLLRQMIDDMTEARRSLPFGKIIFQGYARRYNDLGLHHFRYRCKEFFVRNNDCVLFSVEEIE